LLWQSQIVTQSTYAIVVFMTAVTTLLAPPCLRYLFRREMREHDERATVAHVQL
jgi:Kef-type K+ transport system membrane component KefB